MRKKSVSWHSLTPPDMPYQPPKPPAPQLSPNCTTLLNWPDILQWALDHDPAFKQAYEGALKLDMSENDRLKLMVRHLLNEKRRLVEDYAALGSGELIKLKGN